MKAKALFLSITITALTWAGITPEQLDQRIQSGENLLIIDVRSSAAYQHEHIPGAINIPMHLVGLKRIPTDRPVIFYGDGMGVTYAEDAQSKMKNKTGRDVEILDGGISAWKTWTNRTTVKKGFQQIKPDWITYDQLMQIQERNILLVDLRPKKRLKGEDPLTKLHQQLPAARLTENPFLEAKPAKKGKKPYEGEPPFFVLIDTNDGMAQKTAARLKAAGHKRIAILAGGEAILLREGRPGLERN